MKKIAIIGAGWVGCHLANTFKNKYNITLFDKEEEMFSGTSYYNQNRLHLGFHYPRSYKTRKLCKNSYQQFINVYPDITDKVKNNIYAVPEGKSILDFETIKQIYSEEIEEEILLNKFKNIEGAFLTKERFINFNKARNYFKDKLKDIFCVDKITNINKLSKKYDFVFNCTNNHIVVEKCEKDFYELTITLLCEKKRETQFEAVTLIDGNFFSIYPYSENLYTFTDVKETPIKKFNNVNDLEEYKKTIDINILENKIKIFFENAEQYYPDINKDFKYKNYYLSTKSKFLSTSDDRSPVIKINDNIISFFTGKIQGIFNIENFVKNCL